MLPHHNIDLTQGTIQDSQYAPERNFLNAHKTTVINEPDVEGNDDTIFTASNIQPSRSSLDPHGWAPGTDTEIYNAMNRAQKAVYTMWLGSVQNGSQLASNIEGALANHTNRGAS